jgi:hypothetical protein
MQNQTAWGELITLVLTIVIMLGGFAMIISAMTGTPLVGRMYSAIFRSLVLRPLRWGLRQLGRSAEQFLRWGARQLGRLMIFLARLVGRGIRWTWVRLTA